MKNKLIISISIWLIANLHLAASDIWPIAFHQPDTARDTICYMAALSTVVADNSAPFWIHSLTMGQISKEPYSGNLSAAIYKPSTRPHRWYDYDFGIVLSAHTDTKYTTAYFQSLYAHARLYIVDFTVGITPLITGSQNPQLTTGGLLFSGNAHSIPRISIGIDQYTPVPGLYGYLEVKGGVTHGWMADNSWLDTSIHTTNTLLHYKYVGLRVGGTLPVNISYELHHAAQWGGKSPTLGAFSTSWDSFKHIFLAHGGGNNLSDQLNAEGNHIGFQELALTAKWDKWQITAYWQTLFEDKSADLIGRSNQEDGLWGVAIQQTQWPFINGLSYEFLNTTAQNGPWHDRDGLIYGGCSNYYNNSSYKQGWTHFGNCIGNAMMTPDNNRVRTHFIGLTGDIYGYSYRIIVSQTRNWGTYRNPTESNNTAFLFEINKHLEKAWGLDLGLRLAADFGNQYGNNFGAMISIRKQGIIHNY